jgi:hypothetical protein
MDQLHRLAVRTTQRAAVCVAFEEMHPRYRRQAFDLVQGELERTVHHPVHQQTMLLGIEIRDAFDVVHQKMKAGRRDDPVQILKRCHQRGVGD